MTFKTIVVLTKELRANSVIFETIALIEEYEAAGVLLPNGIVEELEGNLIRYTRTWTTEQAANGWIAYQNSLVPPLVSATVVEE